MNLFIAGTDTNVGKTVVSTAIALKLGWSYWKPIQSGTTSETDSEWCERFVGKDKIHPELYSLKQPLSPHQSAKLDEQVISTRDLSQRAKLLEFTVIEGAGGLMVPLNDSQLQIDWIQELAMPLILVARSTLGTLNHTFLSLEALRSRQIEPVGIVLVGPENAANASAIEKYGKTTILGALPLFESLNHETIELAARLIHLTSPFTPRFDARFNLRSNPRPTSEN